MSFYNDEQKEEINLEASKDAANDIVPLIYEEVVTDGTDYEPAFHVRAISVNVDGLVEYELANMTAGNTVRKQLIAGVMYPLQITKIYFTTGTKGNTELGKTIQIGY